MSALVKPVKTELKSNAWTVSTSPDLSQFIVGKEVILKIFSQEVGNQMQGMCRFERGFEQLLPLFRGLILLGKPSSLSLIYDFDRAQAFFTFFQSEKVEVVRFFNRIIELLKREVAFKEILDQVIENKKRFRAEQSLLHSALKGAAWD
ncbi:hypothetical protein J0A67_08815 [Algoriphagus aestuariicola]|jgi:hypothetical protein|uniref:Uncharacterized protein n=1 Tax=Algoriphagus aestuariicola TaxID=1852016 RepID=A0ABS3BPH7_9BACT|nr:hypothetical protein [Algoriphagus aestuariicola]MBN7800960.1 hypothetical protein [Algoriphagus aestuariicola]